MHGLKKKTILVSREMIQWRPGYTSSNPARDGEVTTTSLDISVSTMSILLLDVFKWYVHALGGGWCYMCG